MNDGHLVEAIQFNFASFDGLPSTDGADPGTNLDGELDLEPRPRPSLPEWLLDVVGADGSDVSQRTHTGRAVSELSRRDIFVVEGGSVPPPLDIKDLPPIDALAFYLPFHYYRHNWGIYIRESGIVALASASNPSALTPPDRRRLEMASSVLREHEQFHFVAEIAVSRAEILRNGLLYDRFFHHPFAACLEEALANARAWQRVIRKTDRKTQKLFRKWMHGQGPGYEDFDGYIQPLSFREGLSKAGELIRECTIGFPHETAMSFIFAAPRTKPPIHVVHDVGSRLGIIRPFPKFRGLRVLVHTNDHPPPHIHIEIPPGKAVTRYRWPEKVPVQGDPRITGRRRKALDEYLDRFGQQIDRKVLSVYGM